MLVLMTVILSYRCECKEDIHFDAQAVKDISWKTDSAMGPLKRGCPNTSSQTF